MKILGVRYGHDAGAAIIINGKIVADVSEERFTRIKNDGSFPINAIEYCLKTAQINSDELDVLSIPTIFFQEAFWRFFEISNDLEVIKADIEKEGKIFNSREKIRFTTERTKEPQLTESTVAPTLPIYRKQFVLNKGCKIFLIHHHLSHAASACYTSGIENGEALCVTMDGAGDEVSIAIFQYENKNITCLKTFSKDASLGWFYALATEAIGWRQSRDEWKLMGLAPFGTPSFGGLEKYYPHFERGELKKNHKFGFIGRWYDHGANHYHSFEAQELSLICKKMGKENFAAEVQRIVCDQAMEIILPWMDKTENENLLCAGGFFLNVKFNQKIWETGKIKKHWVYPDSGDSGLSVGAALFAHHFFNKEATVLKLDNMYKGPEFSNEEIKKILSDRNIKYSYHENISQITAELLMKDYVVGWFQGRMETGPRALGNRSILMSPLKEENRDIINKKIKYRETFRPFCPSILYGKEREYLKNYRDAFFMVISFEAGENAKNLIPAVVHIDNTARPQFVVREVNDRYYDLISNFGKLSGVYAVLNTSLNINGEPIVCTPREAIKCFYDTGMDAIVLGNYLLMKDGIVL